jgi:hypothetical protein
VPKKIFWWWRLEFTREAFPYTVLLRHEERVEATYREDMPTVQGVWRSWPRELYGEIKLLPARTHIIDIWS